MSAGKRPAVWQAIATLLIFFCLLFSPVQATTITEIFPNDTTNLQGSVQDLTWDAVTGGVFWDVVSGELTSNTSATTSCRAQHDLDTADHYAQVVVTRLDATSSANHYGVAARFTSITDEETFYEVAMLGTGAIRLSKLVDGVRTTCETTANTKSLPATLRIECEGNDIRAYLNDVQMGTTWTDPSPITGNVRCGLVADSHTSNANFMDNFEAGNLAGDGRAARAMYYFRMRR